MTGASQRPLAARYLALEPLTIGDRQFDDLDLLLAEMGDSLTADQIVDALNGSPVSASRRTLYRWKSETDGE